MKTKTIPPAVLEQLLSADFQKKFWSKVNPKRPDECWPIPCPTHGEYPRVSVRIKGKNFSYGAHKIAWTIHNKRDVPAGEFVLHKCVGNRNYCNPLHLKSGNQFENMQDMISQARQNYLKGEANPAAKITDETVRQIRRIYQTKQFSLSQIGEMFNLDPSGVRKIAIGIYWKHVQVEQAAPGQ